MAGVQGEQGLAPPGDDTDAGPLSARIDDRAATFDTYASNYLLATGLPIFGPTMEMHDSEDNDSVWADLMNDSIRESLHQGPVNPGSHPSRQTGMLLNPLQCGIDRFLESTPQTILFRVIPGDGLLQFRPRWCEDDHL